MVTMYFVLSLGVTGIIYVSPSAPQLVLFDSFKAILQIYLL